MTAITNVNNKIETAGNHGVIAQGNPLSTAHKSKAVGKPTIAFRNPKANRSSIVVLLVPSRNFLMPCNASHQRQIASASAAICPTACDC